MKPMRAVFVAVVLLSRAPLAQTPYEYLSIDETIAASLPDAPRRHAESDRHRFFELIGDVNLTPGVVTFSGQGFLNAPDSAPSAKEMAAAWTKELNRAGILYRSTERRVGVYDAVSIEAGPPYNDYVKAVRKTFIQTGKAAHTFSVSWETPSVPPSAEAFFASIRPGPRAALKRPGCGCTSTAPWTLLGALALAWRRRTAYVS